MKRMLVTGSRYHRAWPVVWQALWDMQASEGEDLLLTVGDCPSGADLWARRWAEFYQRPVDVHVADWKRLRGNAGPTRNTGMVQTEPAIASAFFVPWDPCRGTSDCLRKLRKASVPTAVYR